MTSPQYPWQAPFVCDVEPIDGRRTGAVDIHARGDNAPAIVFVHGGPLPAGLPVTPRDWPVYRGYAALAVEAGLAAVTIDHDLHGVDDYPAVYQQIRYAIDAARTDSSVDADRVAVWAFSGGAPLVAPLLADPPAWLRCVAFTYPILDSTSDIALLDGRRATEVLRADAPSVVLTRVGREAAPISAGVDAFVARARSLRVALEVIDVPDGQHGFDALPAVDGACAAVHAALERVRGALVTL